jgi:hypothetical protein
MRNTTYYPRRERQTVAKKNTDSHNGSSEKENLFTNRASTVLKFQATYSSTDSYDDLPELVHVEMEQEWIEEKLPAVAEDFNSGLSVVYYQINDRLSVTIKKLTLVIDSQFSDVS